MSPWDVLLDVLGTYFWIFLEKSWKHRHWIWDILKRFETTWSTLSIFYIVTTTCLYNVILMTSKRLVAKVMLEAVYVMAYMDILAMCFSKFYKKIWHLFFLIFVSNTWYYYEHCKYSINFYLPKLLNS